MVPFAGLITFKLFFDFMPTVSIPAHIKALTILFWPLFSESQMAQMDGISNDDEKWEIMKMMIIVTDSTDKNADKDDDDGFDEDDDCRLFNW